MLSIIDTTGAPFPSTSVNGRQCFAVPFHAAFAIRVKTMSEAEVVIAVDGRDTLSNAPASPILPGVIINAPYTCPGFQTDNGTAASFVHMPKGRGLTTAERNGSADSCGLVAAVLYARDTRDAPVAHSVLRGAGGAGPRGGAMAGPDVGNHLGETQWTRGRKFGEDIVEYDTREGWLSRGVVIPDLNTATPWPGVVPPIVVRAWTIRREEAAIRGKERRGWLRLQVEVEQPLALGCSVAATLRERKRWRRPSRSPPRAGSSGRSPTGQRGDLTPGQTK